VAYRLRRGVLLRAGGDDRDRRGRPGPDAPDWLEGLGVPARLVGADRSVHVFGGWPT
jgi:hypothetical protein